MLEQMRKAAASGRVVALADIVPDVDGYRGRGGIANCVESGSIGENALRELKLRDIEQSGRRRFGLGCGRRERQGADEIGRASCRERVCQYVEISVGALSINKHNKEM